MLLGTIAAVAAIGPSMIGCDGDEGNHALMGTWNRADGATVTFAAARPPAADHVAVQSFAIPGGVTSSGGYQTLTLSGDAATSWVVTLCSILR